MAKPRKGSSLPRRSLPELQREAYIRSLPQRSYSPTFQEPEEDVEAATDYREHKRVLQAPPPRNPVSPPGPQQTSDRARNWTSVIVGVITIVGVICGAVYKFSKLESAIEALETRVMDYRKSSESAITETRESTGRRIDVLTERMDKYLYDRTPKK